MTFPTERDRIEPVDEASSVTDSGEAERSTPSGATEPQWLDPAIEDRPRKDFHSLSAAERSPGLRRAIAWFGFRSFWGHLRRFAASAIATEDVDTRDWMEPTDPEELARRVASTLGADDFLPTVTQCLGRDVWIDFIADTGDDAELAERIGRMLFREYVAPDPRDPSQEVLLPRGDLLIHGGDTAYPVATADEIHDRLVVPWNRSVLANGDDEKVRVLLGIPGNHDWYDGLDGFARMFRERHYGDDPEAQTEPLDFRFLGRAFQYVGQFLAGETLKKSKALVVSGYKPLQRSSYFVLPLTPTIHLYGVDRQLRRIDYRQRRFLQGWSKRHPDVARILVMHDPVFPFGRPNRAGLSTLRSLRLSPEYEPHLCLAGDIHHYRRETVGRSIHVTAGGGGAFLHPSPMDDAPRAPAECVWPGPKQSRALLGRIPFHIAFGRAGLIVHAAMLLLFAPALGLGGSMLGRAGLVPGSILAGLLSAVVMAFVGGVREENGRKVAGLAAIAGTIMGLLPALALTALEPLSDAYDTNTGTWVWAFLALVVALGAGGLVFGVYLTALTALGYEMTQAFTAIAHHGYKHFVRLRVHADGSGADVFVVGVEDPFDSTEKPRLVDSFFWESPVKGGEAARRSSASPDPGGLRPSVDRRNLKRRAGESGARGSLPTGLRHAVPENESEETAQAFGSSIPPPPKRVSSNPPPPSSRPPPKRGGSDPPPEVG